MSDNPFAEFDPRNQPSSQESLQKLNKETGRVLLTKAVETLLTEAFPRHKTTISYLSNRSSKEESWMKPIRNAIDTAIEEAYDKADRHTGGHGLKVSTWVDSKSKEIQRSVEQEIKRLLG